MLRCVHEYVVYLCMSQTMCVEVRRQFVESILSYHGGVWEWNLEYQARQQICLLLSHLTSPSPNLTLSNEETV